MWVCVCVCVCARTRSGAEDCFLPTTQCASFSVSFLKINVLLHDAWGGQSGGAGFGRGENKDKLSVGNRLLDSAHLFPLFVISASVQPIVWRSYYFCHSKSFFLPIGTHSHVPSHGPTNGICPAVICCAQTPPSGWSGCDTRLIVNNAYIYRKGTQLSFKRVPIHNLV